MFINQSEVCMWFYSVDKDNFSQCDVEPGHKFPNGQQLIKVVWGKDSDNEVHQEFTESRLQYVDEDTGEVKSKLIADDDVEEQSDAEFAEMLERVLSPGGAGAETDDVDDNVPIDEDETEDTQL